MEQPFYLLRPAYIDRLLGLDKKYFVTQTYKRGQREADKVQKTSMLISEYDNIGLAKGHLAAIRQDKLAAIIDTNKPEHLAKLREIVFAIIELCLLLGGVAEPTKISNLHAQKV